MFKQITPERFMQLRADVAARGHGLCHSHITQLDAQVLSVESNANETLVCVRFYGQIQQGDTLAALVFQEVWNIVRAAQGDRSWRLAEIQQIH